MGLELIHYYICCLLIGLASNDNLPLFMSSDVMTNKWSTIFEHDYIVGFVPRALECLQ